MGALDQTPRREGVLVQEHVTGGIETIVGVTHDPVLRPAMPIGRGRIFAKILHNVAVHRLPLDELDAEDMLRGLYAFAFLDGVRYFYPRSLCPFCWSEGIDWEVANGLATVHVVGRVLERLATVRRACPTSPRSPTSRKAPG